MKVRYYGANRILYGEGPKDSILARDSYLAEIRRIAATELKGPRCWCGTPVLDWRAHRAWHEAGYPRE